MSTLNAVSAPVRAAGRLVEKWFFAPADPRAYAAMRIAYAVTAFCVLVNFWKLRLNLLSASGFFGGASVNDPATFNVFLWARSDGAVTAVTLGAALAILCLGLGVLPRVSAIATYVWVISYSSTATVATCGWDTILRVLGFVMIVSPTVRTWSVGKAAANESPPVYGLRLAQWQMMLIYVCTVWLKAPDQYWRNGDTIQYFLMSMFARFPTAGAARLGVVGGLLAYGTLLIEASVPFLLWMRKTRWLGVFLGASLHVGIAIVSKLALFSLAMAPFYVSFFERQDFDRMARILGKLAPAPPRRPASAARAEPT